MLLSCFVVNRVNLVVKMERSLFTHPFVEVGSSSEQVIGDIGKHFILGFTANRVIAPGGYQVTPRSSRDKLIRTG